MAVPLLLLNLPFLLLFLLILCGHKKKKSNEETSPAPVKISTASKRSNEPLKEAPPPVSTSNSDGNPSASTASPAPVNISTASKTPEAQNKPEKSKESQKEVPPRPNAKNKRKRSKPLDKPRASTNDNKTLPFPPSPRSIIEEEMQKCPSEERQIKLANIIVDIHKDFRLPYDLDHLTREQKRSSMPHCRFEQANQEEIEEKYSLATEAYKRHMNKCTNPKKKKTEDEQCPVCKAYYEFLAMLYDEYENSQSMDNGLERRIMEQLYYYSGKLPNCLENTEWPKRKEQLKKEMGNIKLGPPPVGPLEERLEKFNESAKKIAEIKKGANYWKGSDDEFRQRMAEDFEKARKIYQGHDCRGIVPSVVVRGCPVCAEYMVDNWAGRLYKESLEKEERCPEGMKRQLEEDFYIHLQMKFDRPLPKYVVNTRWIYQKKWITEEKAKDEKRQKEKLGRK